MLKFVLTVALVFGSFASANAQVNGDLRGERGGFDRDGRGGNDNRDNRGGMDRHDHGNRFQWAFQQIDHNGCKRCEVRANEYQTRGCTDLRAYADLCNRRNMGIRLACEKPGTKNDDVVYVCTFVGR